MPQSQSFEARLIIRRQDTALQASWLVASGSESKPFSLELPLGPKDAQDLRWYLETFIQFPGHGDRARARGIEARMEEWGLRAFRAIFTNPDGAEAHRGLLAAAETGGHSLLTLATTEPDVLAQPWELVRDNRGPLAFQGVTIRRQLLTHEESGAATMSLPLRVLVVVSRPTDIGFIDPRTSTGPVLEALERLPDGAVTVDFCDPPTLSRLEEILETARNEQRPYHVVHFDGHGDFLPRSGNGALAFEDDDAKTNLVKGTKLGGILKELNVPLVLLEACRGSQLSDRPVYGAVAPALLQSGVSSVIAFSYSVHVEATRLFVERFYQRLGAGNTVGRAFAEATLRLHKEPARWLHLGPNAETVELQDWCVPQLYQVGNDPAVFAIVAGPARQAGPTGAPRTVALPGFPPSPMYRFHGRALELLHLERALRRQPAVLLHGMGGMGKTALAREAAHWWVRTGKFATAVFFSFERKQGAERVIQLLGEALEGEAFSARATEDQWQTAVRLFRERPVLLVWDNFESTLPIFQQGEAESLLEFDDEARREVRRLYQELTSGQPRGRLLVTCRADEPLLPGIGKVSLGGLARPDSLHLLAAILDGQGLKLEEREGYGRHEIDELLTMLADHPLSISLVTPHFKELQPQAICEEFGRLLERFVDPSAPEERDRSLVASLEFSKKRLSAEARRLLPYLAWFQIGVHETFFLEFTELSAEVWAPVRAELVATALLTVEQPGDYLRFHPTLPFAAESSQVANLQEAQERFLDVYLTVAQTGYQALRGQEPAFGMALVAREDANIRSALLLCFRCDDRRLAGILAELLRIYLEMAGRLRERDALVQWMRGQLSEDSRLDEVACNSIREEALRLFERGRGEEAIEAVRSLIRRLQTEGLADGRNPTFHLALSELYLGRLLSYAGHSDLALAPLEEARAAFLRLGEAGLDNLAVALGFLADAYVHLSQFDAALRAAEEGLSINRQRGRIREIAVGLSHTGQILAEQQRFGEAEARYREAIQAAQEGGDLQLQGLMLEHLGEFQEVLGNCDRAIELYHRALRLFQDSGAVAEEMRTCGNLANAEGSRDQLDAAEGWYDRCQELAQNLNDRNALADVAHNLGILHQIRAQQTRDRTEHYDLNQAEANLQRMQSDGGSCVTVQLTEGLVRGLVKLAQSCPQARTSRTPLPSHDAALLAFLQEGPAPLPVVASFLQAVAAGQPLPPVPADLPPPLGDILNALVEAIST